ncbi:MAG TPA: hypothetical protein PLD05_06615 [Thermogutta sp.]|nr:hypothetical protein [Thermogutta sp.]
MLAKKVNTPQMGSLGRGRKRCPSCNAIVAARAVKCRFCEYNFLDKPRRGKTARGTVADPASVEKLVAFINAHGGLENAKKVISDVRGLVGYLGSLDLIAQQLNVVGLIKQQVKE